MNSIFDQGVNFIKNLPKPIAIIGLGASGESAFNLLLATGVKRADILLFDEKSSHAEISSWDELLSRKPRSGILSPGVPMASKGLQDLISRGISLYSEVHLGGQFFTQEILIGITGSLGKSTTAALVGQALSILDPNVFVGGNFGVPVTQYAREALTAGKQSKFLVIELSSYQLELPLGFELDWSIITYFSPNHLERYPNLNAYYQQKTSIIQQTKKIVFLNSASKDLENFVGSKSYPSNQLLWIDSKKYVDSLKLQDSLLLGEHNLQNLSLTAALIQNLEISENQKDQCIARAKNFPGLSHRMENLGTISGIHYINDSKATALDSVRTAVQTCLSRVQPSAKLFLLLGGRDKKLPWSEMSYLRDISTVRCVFFGESRKEIIAQTGLIGADFPKLSEAIQYCQNQAQSGDWIVLSPGGTSLDEFKNFEERGNYFRKFATSSS